MGPSSLVSLSFLGNSSSRNHRVRVRGVVREEGGEDDEIVLMENPMRVVMRKRRTGL
jgi:hypothetical protein